MTISPMNNAARFGAVHVLTSDAVRRLREFETHLEDTYPHGYPRLHPAYNAYVAGMTGDHGFLKSLGGIIMDYPFGIDGFASILFSNTGKADLQNFRESCLIKGIPAQAEMDQAKLDAYNQAKDENRLNVIS